MMEECSRRMADFYLKQGKASVDVELKDIFSRYTNDVIATATYGIECDSLNHRDNDFYDYGKDINRAAGVGNIKILLYSAFPNMMKVQSGNSNQLNTNSIFSVSEITDIHSKIVELFY